MIDYEHVLKTFKKYLENFNGNEEAIAIKISHSYHVADLAMKLGKRLELSKEELALVKTLGLLHDMGRFMQYEKTKKYDDVFTHIDHAKLTTDYLFKEGHIKDFKIPETDYRVIEKAIYNHNKLKIEEGLTEKECFFAKFLRDVDKIDIYRQQGTSSIRIATFNAHLSKKVEEDFYKHHLIDETKLQNDSDRIVAEIAYTFDINFKESFELLYDTDNLELYLATIEVEKGYEEEYEEIKNEVRKFVQERIDEKC